MILIQYNKDKTWPRFKIRVNRVKNQSFRPDVIGWDLYIIVRPYCLRLWAFRYDN